MPRPPSSLRPLRLCVLCVSSFFLLFPQFRRLPIPVKLSLHVRFSYTSRLFRRTHQLRRNHGPPPENPSRKGNSPHPPAPRHPRSHGQCRAAPRRRSNPRARPENGPRRPSRHRLSHHRPPQKRRPDRRTRPPPPPRRPPLLRKPRPPRPYPPSLSPLRQSPRIRIPPLRTAQGTDRARLRHASNRLPHRSRRHLQRLPLPRKKIPQPIISSLTCRGGFTPPSCICFFPSSRPERPDFSLLAGLWRVGPRSGGTVAIL